MNRVLSTVLERAVESATLAPSPHNTQPWRFAVGEEHVELWLDRGRVLRVADPDAWEARLSCGAALFTLDLALRADGVFADLRICPDPARTDLLATARLAGNHRSTSDERALAEAVPRRHTNRRPFSGRAVPTASRHRLETAALAQGGTLVLLDPSAAYDSVVALIRRAEFLQANDIGHRTESASWTGRPAGCPDGVPASSAAPPPLLDGLVVMRDSHANHDLPARAYEQQPLLAAVVTSNAGPHEQVHAGMVMQRVLLAATADGLATSFLSQPFETAGTRAALTKLFKYRGQVQTLLRIGYGYPVPVTGRRAANDVTTALE
ncbi:Putative NAD(P)H nitroreductase [Amycolatopsis sp. CA-230715]|nr:Putative NAD(P)H nitroreductase [Amycolatopsis sp. CA-230715]